MTKKITGMPRNQALADRFLLACAGRTQAEVAALTGVKINTLGRVQTGHPSVGKRTLVALAVGLQVSLEWLSHGTGDMRPLPGQSELRRPELQTDAVVVAEGGGAAPPPPPPDTSSASEAAPEKPDARITPSMLLDALGLGFTALAEVLRQQERSKGLQETARRVREAMFGPLPPSARGQSSPSADPDTPSPKPDRHRPGA